VFCISIYVPLHLLIQNNMKFLQKKFNSTIATEKPLVR
ncbi:hypothetical protein D046_3658B, partial [Vibrio parahaemolyticus V-223/04]